MGERTEISWTDATFNPWIGCARVSPGCTNCYAEARNDRYHEGLWGKNAPRRRTSPANWAQPLKWDRNAAERGAPTLVFCASLADVFEDRDDLRIWRDELFDLIEATPHLIWQLLTKRPENVLRMVPRRWVGDPEPVFCGSTIGFLQAIGQWPANVWIGTTIEDQQRADERIPELLRIPAAVRFLSFEPLLGPVFLKPEWLGPDARVCQVEKPISAESARAITTLIRAAGERLGGRYIDWAIVGGESGPKFRALDLDDARMLVGQLQRAAVPTWFKQIGGRTPTAGGHLLDGVTYHEMPAQAQR